MQVNSATWSDLAQSAPSAMEKHIGAARPLLLFFGLTLFLGASTLAIFYSADFNLTVESAIGLGILGCLGIVILNMLIDICGDCVVVDLLRPTHLYSLLFFSYYVVPTWIALLLPECLGSYSLEICGLVACSFVAFCLGVKISGYRYTLQAAKFRLDGFQLQLLSWLCYLAVPLLVWYYGWRLSIGAFYTHARYYEQDPSVFAGFMENFVAPLQLPIILVTGLLLRESRGRFYFKIKCFLFVYTSLSVVIYTITSQFRPAVICLLFAIIALNLSRRSQVRLKHQIAVGLVALGLLLTIQGVRILLEGSSFSDNQLYDSASNSLDGLTGALSGDRPVLDQRTMDRLVMQPTFLAQIMDRVHDGHPYLYGAPLLTSIYSLVPRAAWSGKPVVMPMQIMLRRAFGLREQDDAPGPLVEFYANAGWVGVITGFAFLGALMGFVTRLVVARSSVGFYLLLCWWWTALANLENEVILSLLVSLRVVIIVYFVYWFLNKLLRPRCA